MVVLRNNQPADLAGAVLSTVFAFHHIPLETWRCD